MSFFANMFGGNGQGQQQQQPQGQQPSQQQQQQQQPANGNGNPQNPGNTNPNEPGDPTEMFSKIWDNGQQQEDQSPQFRLDEKILSDVAGKLDFMQGIDQGLMQKALAGDVQSLIDLMTQSQRNQYKQTVQHMGLLTGNFVDQHSAHQSKRVPSMIRDEMVMGTLTDNGNAQYAPHVRKQLAATAKQFQAAHPDASPAQIAQMAKDYFRSVNEGLNGKSQEQQANNQQKPQATDWDAYFGQEANSF